ncbi:signal peptidase I [Olsenella sp. DNF00959]|uniref:signal peptidase I n=1 Tax=Olsenella sp. DNF00959 TaxID=1476999 RepID=UPI0007958BF9|nr:signal peptidase I [Olsenella sp. DNF00959]KXB61743.1 signal peptidase I [Olsenella sp. DNF00959]
MTTSRDGASGVPKGPSASPRRAAHLRETLAVAVLPTTDQVRREYERVRRQHGRGRAAKNAVAVLGIVFAASVLGSLLVFPLFRIYGDSMVPTLSEGDVVLATKGGDIGTGDLVAFSYNNKSLVKRVIAGPGDWVDIDEAGNVSVNGQPMDEPYLQAGAKSKGQCDIALPYQVPEGRYFVMGDHRSVSVDSRTSQVGCISADQVEGRLALRVWPPSGLGSL